MSQGDPRHDKKPLYREMTVGNIREQTGADAAQVVFLQSARFYRLLRTNPGYDRILRGLHSAMTKQAALRVRIAAQDSDIIEDIGE